jgi:hypothetical protein|tara:strand:+ start:1101 stop:1235 length:135 start_codon:yes stop_codon:yes gene_type:complete
MFRLRQRNRADVGEDGFNNSTTEESQIFDFCKLENIFLFEIRIE